MTKDNLIDKFEDIRPLYERFTKKIFSLLEELIQEGKIEYHLIESRTKKTSSFQEKIVRKQEKYSDLSEITDLSGIRIIVYYPIDIPKVVTIINREFKIDKKNSRITGEDLNPNEFGYLSSHIVFNLKENRKKLVEWSNYSDFKCEVQIRTVLQHAWASISHALQYKSKRDIPTNLQRKLFRLAGLFELADEQFVDIRNIHQSLVKQINKDDIVVSEREINLLSISNFIEKSETVNNIYSQALQIGFIDEGEEPNLDNREDSSKSELIRICELIGLKNIRDLENILKELEEKELDNLFNILIETDRRKEQDWYVSPSFILVLVLIYYKIENITIEDLLKGQWAESVASRVLKNTLKSKKTAHNNGYKT